METITIRVADNGFMIEHHEKSGAMFLIFNSLSELLSFLVANLPHYGRLEDGNTISFGINPVEIRREG